MKIKLMSIYVDDQDKALQFYTGVLGFAKKADVTQGSYRWLTVASPEDPQGTELQLARNDNPAAKAYQDAMFKESQPAVMFFADDVQGGLRAHQEEGRRVHDAADRRHRFDHRPAQGRLRQPHPDHPTQVGVSRRI